MHTIIEGTQFMVSEWMISELMFKMLCSKCCEGKGEGMVYRVGELES